MFVRDLTGSSTEFGVAPGVLAGLGDELVGVVVQVNGLHVVAGGIGDEEAERGVGPLSGPAAAHIHRHLVQTRVRTRRLLLVRLQ